MRRIFGSMHAMTRRPMVRQFVKFSLVGASNTVVDFAAYLLFTRAFGVHFLAANVIAFLLAATWSYNWNRRWTFRSNDPRVHRQFVKFLIVATVGLGLTTGILYFLVEHSGLTDIPAKIISVAAVLLWNFLANRFWTFKEKLV